MAVCVDETSKSFPAAITSNASEIASKCRFLRPLSFPEAAEKDLSHFISKDKDVPVLCLFSFCDKKFGVTTQTSILESSEREERSKHACCHPVQVDSPEIESKCSLMDGSEISDSIDAEGHLSATKSVLDVEKEKKFSVKDQWLRHLFLEHKLVVDKVDSICSLKSYSEYWRRRLTEAPITEFVAVIRTNSTADESYGASEDYYLLSDVLPEDKELRNRLKLQRLEAVLQVQQKERQDVSFSHGCLFCSQVFTGNRSVLFQHMLDSHGFNVGQPDNLVFVNEFLDALQQKLDNMQCLYCERSFRDHPTLRDHMRKKQHKKIDAKNHAYDRFYLINYLEPGKTWEDVHAEDDRDILPQALDSEWGDWKESTGSLIFCLFCSHSFKDFTSVVDHMLADHNFNYWDCVKYLNLDYYGQIKLVNYIRRQVYMCICCFCQDQLPSQDSLTGHMATLGHCKMPEAVKAPWEQPQYFFPTYENDGFLIALEDDTT